MANNPDIKILIGALGGASSSGASASLIRNQLQTAFKDGLKIKIKLDDVDIGSIKARIAEQQKGVSNSKAEIDINKQLEQSFYRIAQINKKTQRTDELKQAAEINKSLEQEYQLRLKNESAAKRIVEQEYIAYNNQQRRLDQDRMYENIDRSVKGDLKTDKNYQDLKNYYAELEKTSAKEEELAQKSAERAQRQSEFTAKLNANATSQKASFQQYLQTLNPKALSENNGEIQKIFDNLDAAAKSSGDVAKKAFDDAGNGMKTFKAQMKELGYEGGNTFTYLHSKLKTFVVYLMSSAITMGIVSSIKKAVNVVYELDEALTDLRIVTGGNRASAEELIVTYNKMAQTLGSTTKEISNAAVEWQRQGYGLAETNKLIEASMTLSVVGMVDSAESAKFLTSALKGYKLEAQDAIGIVDKLTSIDLEAAVSAGGLAEAMSRTANSARLAGVDMNTLLGYIAAVAEATQRESNVVGEAFKRIFARYSNVKLGKLVDDETGESLNDFETVLNTIGVTLRDKVTGNFRDFDAVLAEVVKKYKQLDPNSTTVSALAQALGGTLQRENVLALFENYDKAIQYAETAANSTGTATQKMGTHLEGLEAKSNKLTAAFENMANSIIPSGLIGFFLDLGAGAANAGASLGGLPARLIALTAAMSAFKTAGGMIAKSPFSNIGKDLAKPKYDGHQWNIVANHSEEAA